MLRRIGLVTAIFVLTAATVLNWSVPQTTYSASAQSMVASRASVSGNRVSGRGAPAPQLSVGQQEAMRLRLLEIRERVNASVNNNPPSGPGRAAPITPPLAPPQPARRAAAQPPGTLDLYRVFQDPQVHSGAYYIPTEPVAAVNGAHFFAAHNVGAEVSLDGGLTWTNFPLPAGPTNAPNPLGDPFFEFDNSRRVTFFLQMYSNNAVTHGSIRIFVFKNIRDAVLGSWCYYDFEPAADIFPDYPKMAITTDSLFMTTNNIQNGTTWPNSTVNRFPIDPMVACSGFSYSFYNLNVGNGQRVYFPSQSNGLSHTAYWQEFLDTSTVRIYRWRDADGSASTADRTITTSAFGAPPPACQGGANNLNFIRSINTSIAGFNSVSSFGRNRLYLSWQAGPTGGIAEAHIRNAIFTEDPSVTPFTPTLLLEWFAWTASNCWGFPNITSNERGDFGWNLAYGGNGTAVGGVVALSDNDSDPGRGLIFGGQTYSTGPGTHNPPSSRYGDYLGIQTGEPCGKGYAGINYAYSGGTAQANIVTNSVEFGRDRDLYCWWNWANRRPIVRP